ncbi:autotransporter assembly complex protein TamA [Pseudohongiella sp.]|uniref:Translocation and assembly module subunit TamA n=1 Tax=marine sediment metagenome TaxID=412755 RepID=A0A0F9YKN7_9ZZZZ|nr:autotransporter assembly complex family protein [Pseudohongiella sp.]HDZ08158.1 outer membrane protein assembly factor [Pseudohongiella sp.]HEA63126.1 outer membrane protein assembly factor [Pseudohongiella sp.]
MKNVVTNVVTGLVTGAARTALYCTVIVAGNAYAQSPAPAISVSGANEALTDNIRVHVGTPEARCDSGQRRLNRMLPAIRRDVERAAQALGYYRARHEIQITPAPQDGDADAANCWTLSINVTAGEPVLIGEVNVILSDQRYANLFNSVLSEIDIQQGDRLVHTQYEQLKSRLSAQAVDNGFFSARFTRSELAIDLQRNRADINLEFEPGERFRFGRIRISPLDGLSNTFVSRFLTFEESSDYSTDALIELRENLNDSQYFSQISVTPQLSQATENRVPVNVELALRPRRSYTAGAGVSTDIGPRLRLSYEDRYINRRGHRLNADLGISTLQQDPSVSYVIPLSDPVNDSLRISGGFQRLETDSYITNTYRAGVTWRSVVWDNWVQNIFVNYQAERSELTDIAAADRVEEQVNSTITGINWARTRADDPIYPTQGWRLFGQVSGAEENLLSDITFAQLYSSAKLIHSIGPGRLLLRAEAATTLADEVLELPLSVRFFTGGDQSVRGYQFGALGATNADGDVVGGKHLLVGSVEYDVPVVGGWHAAVFYDTGNSFADFNDMKLRDSAGIGVRWRSPIGPIRLDVARGFDDGSFRLHITMGPDL